jgi:hypothetical protein
VLKRMLAAHEMAVYAGVNSAPQALASVALPQTIPYNPPFPGDSSPPMLKRMLAAHEMAVYAGAKVAYKPEQASPSHKQPVAPLPCESPPPVLNGA